jgi:hypothetical protein
VLSVAAGIYKVVESPGKYRADEGVDRGGNGEHWSGIEI